MKRVAVISSFSFFQPGPRIGMQFMAQILARRGYEVHYFSQPSSPVDWFSSSRRPRFHRAWTQPTRSQLVEPGLLEHFARTPYPVHKRCWLLPELQYRAYGTLLPRELRRMRFDLLIHDLSMSFPLMECLQVDRMILRVSDHPEGFAFVAPKVVIRHLLANLDENRYDQTWAASPQLLDYVKERCPIGNHHLLTNGVDIDRFLRVAPQPEPKTAVFVGSLDRWVDLELLDRTARLLPAWRIDLFGPLRDPPTSLAKNLHFKGSLAFERLPEVLSRYPVGLIPFKQNDPLIDMMEKPLKFYEYLAAGLGIAATDAGALRRGMGDWARYGVSAEEYAAAIEQAAGDARKQRGERDAYLRPYSWTHLGQRMMDLVEAPPSARRAA